MIEKLQKISAKLFAETLKIYKLEDLIMHKKAQPKSLIQCCAMYPNMGVGFNIRRKTWPDSMFITVTDTRMKSNRHGKMKGMKYFQDKQQWRAPSKFNGASKRGTWEYNLGNLSEYETDNGMVYTRADFEAYYQFRKKDSLSSSTKDVQQDQPSKNE